MRLLLWMSVFAVALAGLLAGQSGLSGRRAPGFSLPDRNLNRHDLQDYRGKLVLLEFMQARCPRCEKFAQILERAQQKYAEDVVVLSVVNPPSDHAAVAEYIDRNGVETPILFDCGQVAASYFMASPERAGFNVPHLFLIDRSGVIIKDFPYRTETLGIFEGEKLFEEIEAYLKSQQRVARLDR